MILSLTTVSLLAMPAVAQNGSADETFARAVKAFTKSGRARIYDCSPKKAGLDEADRQTGRLVAIAKRMSTGSEKQVAASSNCELVSTTKPSDIFHGIKFTTQAIQDSGAMWLVGDVVESYPQATGYTFEAIVRIPTTPQPANQSVASPPANSDDAKFFEVQGTRTISSSEESGFFVCPSDAASANVMAAAKRLSPSKRDSETAGMLMKAGCREGRGTITGIKVAKLLKGEDVTWHHSSANFRGKAQSIVFWLFY
ncbi:hypothetical protein ACVOMT_05985 [Sphingomonas panni]